MSKKLLLADDSITIQKVIGITFANEDYELTIVGNGDAALEKARSDRPDLILADVFMPGKNGYELCAAVRQEPALSGVPVLLLTGTFEPFDENKARAAGADSWIAKPFESQALIDRVEELLARAPQPAVSAAPLLAAEEEFAPSPEVGADLWGELAEAAPSAALPGEEQPEAAPEETAFPADEEEVMAEEDIWGTISFGEEEMLFEEPVEEVTGDIWGSLELEETAAAEPVPAAAEEAFVFEEEPPVAEAPPAPFEAPVEEEEFLFGEERLIAPAAPAAEWEEPEEEILPLDEMDILEEEDLEMMAEAPASEEEEFFFAEEEEAFPAEEPAAPAGFGEMPAFGEEPAIEEEPIAFEEEFALTEEGPEWGIAEEPAVGIEPSAPAAEAAFLTPAEAAMEPEPAAAPVAAAAVEERVRTLSEEELAQIVERVAGSVIERLAGSVLEKIAWEVVPDLAESLVKEEIRKIKEGAQ